jgi:hypothetical protein
MGLYADYPIALRRAWAHRRLFASTVVAAGIGLFLC